MNNNQDSTQFAPQNKPNHPESRPGRSVFHQIHSLLAVVLLVVVTSCGGDSNTMGPDPDPEPEPNRPVSYSKDIQPIFNSSCALGGCHDSGTSRSGVNLSSYNSAINSIGARYDTLIILPGNPSGSPIVDKISNNNPQFGQRMPLSGSALSSARIDSIFAWIEDGAPNN